MNTSENTELTASIHHIETFSKLGIPISISEVPHTVGRETTRRTQTAAKRYVFTQRNKKKNTSNAKCYAFYPNAVKQDFSVDTNVLPGSAVTIGLGIVNPIFQMRYFRNF